MDSARPGDAMGDAASAIARDARCWGCAMHDAQSEALYADPDE